MEKIFFLETAKELETLAAAIAIAAKVPVIIFLMGNLGAGKTTFARGFLRGLNYLGKVKSPTYTLVEPYYLEHTVYHFDLFRIHDSSELKAMGVEEYFNNEAHLLIEWPEHHSQELPPPDLNCYIEIMTEGRKLRLKACTAVGKEILRSLASS